MARNIYYQLMLLHHVQPFRGKKDSIRATHLALVMSGHDCNILMSSFKLSLKILAWELVQNAADFKVRENWGGGGEETPVSFEAGKIRNICFWPSVIFVRGITKPLRFLFSLTSWKMNGRKVYLSWRLNVYSAWLLDCNPLITAAKGTDLYVWINADSPL